MLSRFRKRVALVTGGATGIGRGIALGFAREGASLALNDINEANLQKTCAEVEELGARCETFLGSVAKGREVVDKAVAKLGRIDILVNNAGVATPTEFLKLKEEEWDRVLEVNLKGAFLMTQAVLPGMLERRYGRIIMMGSIAGKTGGVSTSVAYDVSKAGLIVMARSLARKYGREGITVNAVAPSFVDTQLLADLNLGGAADKSAIASLNVIQRLATPQDVANAVLFLASDESSFITGETLNVNGGRLMD